MSSSDIYIFNEIAKSINNKNIFELIDFTIQNEKDKSNISKLIKYYLSNYTMFDQNVLNKYNIKIKVVPVNSDYKCFEAISFPSKSLRDLIFEKWTTFDKWEEAYLRKTLNSTFLIIPIIKNKEKGKYNNANEWKFGEICVWKADQHELNSIGEEWELAKSIVEKGVELIREIFGKGYRIKNNLLKQSETKFIHLRPHGINSFDIDKPYFQHTNYTIELPKQSFWLNKMFVNQILIKYRWKTNSKEE
jgi:hypothetical protein